MRPNVLVAMVVAGGSCGARPCGSLVLTHHWLALWGSVMLITTASTHPALLYTPMTLRLAPYHARFVLDFYYPPRQWCFQLSNTIVELVLPFWTIGTFFISVTRPGQQVVRRCAPIVCRLLRSIIYRVFLMRETGIWKDLKHTDGFHTVSCRESRNGYRLRSCRRMRSFVKDVLEAYIKTFHPLCCPSLATGLPLRSNLMPQESPEA